MNAVEAAMAFVDERFPDCRAAIVGGSVIRGDGTSTSDLDVVIVTDDPAAPYRESFHAFGWPIETFVHSITSYRRYFTSDVERARPTLCFICSEGVMVRDVDGIGHELKTEARALLEAGPPALTAGEIEWQRYSLTDALDDFMGTDDHAEGLFIAGDLAERAATFWLRHNRQWVGDGKWTIRALQRFDPARAQELVDALTQYFRGEHEEALIAFATRILDDLGGRLFEGYRSAGKRE